MAGPKATEGHVKPLESHGGGGAVLVCAALVVLDVLRLLPRKGNVHSVWVFFSDPPKGPLRKGILSSKMFETDHGYSPVDIVVSPINGLKARSLLLKYSAPCASI